MYIRVCTYSHNKRLNHQDNDGDGDGDDDKTAQHTDTHGT